MGSILIVAALAEELAPLAARLERSERADCAGRRVRRGTLAGRPVHLAVAGEGAPSGPVVERLLAELEPDALLALGVAGGLTPDLGAGELVSGERVIAAGGDVLAPPGWAWTPAATGGERMRGGTVVTVSRIARSPAQKRRLASELGLVERSVVDLESALWARAADGRRLPWLVLRSVSDTRDEELPLDFERFRSAGGAVSRARVAAHAAVRPRLVLELARLRRRVAECALGLAEAAEALVAC